MIPGLSHWLIIPSDTDDTQWMTIRCSVAIKLGLLEKTYQSLLDALSDDIRRISIGSLLKGIG